MNAAIVLGSAPNILFQTNAGVRPPSAPTAGRTAHFWTKPAALNFSRLFIPTSRTAVLEVRFMTRRANERRDCSHGTRVAAFWSVSQTQQVTQSRAAWKVRCEKQLQTWKHPRTPQGGKLQFHFHAACFQAAAFEESGVTILLLQSQPREACKAAGWLRFQTWILADPCRRVTVWNGFQPVRVRQDQSASLQATEAVVTARVWLLLLAKGPATWLLRCWRFSQSSTTFQRKYSTRGFSLRLVKIS